MPLKLSKDAYLYMSGTDLMIGRFLGYKSLIKKIGYPWMRCIILTSEKVDLLNDNPNLRTKAETEGKS